MLTFPGARPTLAFMERNRFRCVLYVQRRIIRDEILLQAQIVQSQPTELEHLNLLWELEHRYSILLKLYDDLGENLYRPGYGKLGPIVGDLTEIYLHRRSEPVPQRVIRRVLDEAGVRTRRGTVGPQHLSRILGDDARFMNDGRHRGWRLRPVDQAAVA